MRREDPGQKEEDCHEDEDEQRDLSLESIMTRNGAMLAPEVAAR